VQRGKEAEGFRRVRKPTVNSVVAVVFSYCYKITAEGRLYVAKQRGRGRVFGSFSEKEHF